MQPAAPPAPPTVRPSPTPKRVLAVIVLLVLAFLGGYVPQLLRADRLDDSLRTAQLDLELANLHRKVGLAAFEAQQSNYANAAAAATAFFDGCARLANDPGLADEPRTRAALGAYAGSRDQYAAQLTSADPLVVQRLASLYLTMDGVLTRRQ